jgi:hypothetical protein
MVMMMVVVVRRGNHLRLRRHRNCEAEDQNESSQKPFHAQIDENPLWRITRPYCPYPVLKTPWLYFCFWS